MHDTQTFDKGYSQQKHARKAHTHTLQPFVQLEIDSASAMSVLSSFREPASKTPTPTKKHNVTKLPYRVQKRTYTRTEPYVMMVTVLYTRLLVHVCSSVYSSCKPSIVLTIDIPDANEKYKQHIRLNPPPPSSIQPTTFSVQP